jgi:hypothetical protein
MFSNKLFFLPFRGLSQLLYLTTIVTTMAEISDILKAIPGHSVSRSLQTECNRTFLDKASLQSAITYYSENSCNKDISTWDVSRITDMSNLFSSKSMEQFNYNLDISAWDMSKVTTVAGMFASFIDFNGQISGWNLGKVTSAAKMFEGALAFNQNLCRWNCTLPKNANVQSMFLSTSCPSVVSPNFSNTTSFCHPCSDVQCGKTCLRLFRLLFVFLISLVLIILFLLFSCYQHEQNRLLLVEGASFVDGEWSIKQQASGLLEIVYTDLGADLKLKYTTGLHNVSLSLYKEDCSTSISTTATTPVLIMAASPNPIISNENLVSKTQDVTFSLSVSASSLNSSNIYSNVTGTLTFCSRVDLSQNGTSYSYLQNLVSVTFNQTGLANFTVNDTALVQSSLGDAATGVVGLNSSLLACICDPTDSTYACSDASTVALTASSFLSVCVAVTTTKAKIADVNTFKISQHSSSVMMDAIMNSKRGELTTTSFSSDYKKTRIKTQLASEFFQGLTADNKASRKLKAEGTISLRLIDGSRRLIYISAEFPQGDQNRNLNSKHPRQHVVNQVLSSFAVDNIEIDESNVGDSVVVLPVKGIVLTVCAGVFALSLCSYLVFVLARKRKQKRESMTSQFCVEDHVW